MRYKEHDKCRICLFYLSNCNALRNLVIKISFRKCYCKDETMDFKERSTTNCSHGKAKTKRTQLC